MILRNSVALVVGASGAIGQVVATELIREGARVALTSRTELKWTAKNKFTESIDNCKAYQLDLTSLPAVKEVIDAIGKQFGRIDIVVNASGAYGPIGPVEENDPEYWARAVQANLVGAFNLVYAVVPMMTKNGGGRIIHFSGGGAAYGRPFFSAYSSSKAALVRFTESIAEELKPAGIYVNAIAPGPVKSAMWDELRAAGDSAGSSALRELEEMDNSGGVPAERAACLAIKLATTTAPITGRLISAVWDDWEHLEAYAETINNSDAWTLRRVPLDEK